MYAAALSAFGRAVLFLLLVALFAPAGANSATKETESTLLLQTDRPLDGRPRTCSQCRTCLRKVPRILYVGAGNGARGSEVNVQPSGHGAVHECVGTNT